MLQVGTIPTTVLRTQVELVQVDDAVSSNASADDDLGIGAYNAGIAGVKGVAEPYMRDILDVMKLMRAHMVTLTQALTPTVNPPVAEVTPPVLVAGLATCVCPRKVAELVEIDPPARPVPRMDYLKVLEYISKLGTKQFPGSVDPMEADEWRSRLVGTSAQLAVLKITRRTLQCTSWKFNHKYFPAEAWDRLKSKFLDLVQGCRTVREYEEEFNRLRRYVGKDLEDEAVPVRRFIRGLRDELWTYCSVCTFHTVSALVERMAMLETNLAEEVKQKVKSAVVSTAQSSDKKRKRDSAEEGKTSSERSECPKCGRYHSGECWKVKGACTLCGKMDHSAKDYPSPASDSRTCHHCGQKGHYRRDCPMMLGGQSKERAEASKPVQNRGQTSAPRVYELSKDKDEGQPYKAITGTDLDRGKGKAPLGQRPWKDVW
ncbi:hypothetical protein N665_1705s0001 [Sinapis alba]|nr:hypothetical protein N665_1705s0001 [Sinapis alba]